MAMITPVASTNAPITGINNAAPITPVLITPEAAFVWRPSFCKPKLNISGHITEWNKPAASINHMPTMEVEKAREAAIHAAPKIRQALKSFRGSNFARIPAPTNRPTIMPPQ